MVNALGIVGSQASGFMEFLSDGSWTKRLHPGWAAHSGIIAALLAKEGFTGPKSILEGRHGFIKAHTDQYDLGKLTQGLGERFLITDVSVKPHSCCRYIQPAIDAVLELTEKNSIRPEDIEEVTVGTVKPAITIAAEPPELKYSPRSVVDAQFSMPFGVAVALLKGRAFIEEYTEKMIRNSEVLALAKKVKVVNDPELDKVFPRQWQATAKIKTKDGSVYAGKVETPKGDPANPLTDKELEEKFKTLACDIFPSDRVNEIIQTVQRLERLTDIKELTDLLR